MTENTTEVERIDTSELFTRASELPADNYRTRTIAQILAAARYCHYCHHVGITDTADYYGTPITVCGKCGCEL